MKRFEHHGGSRKEAQEEAKIWKEISCLGGARTYRRRALKNQDFMSFEGFDTISNRGGNSLEVVDWLDVFKPGEE